MLPSGQTPDEELNSGTTLTTGNSATITMGYTGDNKVIWNEYDPDTNKQVIMTDHLYGNEGRIYQASISGANITVPSTYYAITDEGSEEEGSKALSYDPDNDKWILFKAQSGNVLRANVLTASGDTFTSGTVTQISSDYFRWLAPYYDTEKNKTVLAYRYNNGQPYYAGIGFVTISGTTPSFIASSTTLGNTTTTSSPSIYNQPHQAIYNPDTKSGIVVAAFSTSTPSDGMGVVLYYGTTTSTVVNGSVFAGTALSATALELKTFPASTIVGKADGAVTKGKPVIVEADGDFAQVAQASSTENYSFSKGSATALVAADTGSPLASCFDISAQRFILVYINYDASNYLYGNVVEVNSSNVVTSRGIQTIISSSNGGQQPSIAYDSANEKSMLVYMRGAFSSDLGCRVLTATGTSLSVGAEVVINDNDSSGSQPKVVYEPTSGKLVVTYVDQSNSSFVTAQVGTISGTTSSWSSNTYISAGGTATQIGLAAGNGKVLFLTTDDSNNADARAGTISGVALTLGSPVEFDADNASNPYPSSDNIVCYDTQNDRFFAGYKGTGDNLYGMVFQISGTTVSHGTRNLILYRGQDFSVPQSSDIGKIPLIFGVYVSDSLYYREATITSSNNSIAYNTAVTLSTANTDATSLAYDSTNVRLLATYHLANDNIEAYGIIPNGTRTVSTPNLTAENYIGIAQETVSTNEDVKVTTISGVDANQSSLTPAQTYYVQTDGTLSTTAGSPSVVAGTAIASTQLLVSRS